MAHAFRTANPRTPSIMFSLRYIGQRCFQNILTSFASTSYMYLAVTVLLCTAIRGIPADDVIVRKDYCSFFNNRAPTAQPGLRNCTWYKEKSCCLQQEIEATFGRVKPLKGASPACQRYLNYLMCYICSPDQSLFYQNERLTVCEEFCNGWYGACRSAILKGSVIGDLYISGSQFCDSRSFKVHNETCFNFDLSPDLNRAGSLRQECSVWIFFAAFWTALVGLEYFTFVT